MFGFGRTQAHQFGIATFAAVDCKLHGGERETSATVSSTSARSNMRKNCRMETIIAGVGRCFLQWLRERKPLTTKATKVHEGNLETIDLRDTSRPW